MSARAVFLDRDGVLVIPEIRGGRSFAPTRLEEFRLYPTAADCARRLKAAGFKLIVVTNQPDVGNGLVDRCVVEAMHEELRAKLPVDDIEVCYHAKSDECDCRKPKAGMLRRAAARHRIDCNRSIMIGDRRTDVEAGHAVGCRTIYIDLGYREAQRIRPDLIVSSLQEATDIILTQPDIPSVEQSHEPS
jgi:D-glycero-D-manno-heptose 1,7-bisphosphate phosphatase